MAERSAKVVVVGGTYVDMAVKCGQIPSQGQSVDGTELSYTTTGPGPIQAAQAALCGCQVHLVTKLGGDPFAQMALKTLRDYRVNTDCVCTAAAKNTGVLVTLVDATGENAACQYAGANAALQAKDVEAADQVISEAAVCLIHGRLPHEAIVTALRLAALHGTKVILNPASPLEKPAAGCPDLPAEYFSVGIIIPNLGEAAEITEQAASIRTAKLIGADLVARGVACAIVTMGRRGCMVVDRTGADHIPAFQVDLVDHTGSGDAFAGALAAYCALSDNVRRAAQFASAAGALACTKFGALEALPTKAEIIQLLQREDIDLLPLGQ